MDSGSEVRPRKIAYFSMEIGLEVSIPTYSGGLGVLAGDTLKAAADLGVPIIGVTLLAEEGYFTQELDPETGNQTEKPAKWDPASLLGSPLPQRATVTIEGRDVQIRAWEYEIAGVSGGAVPVLFLDTDIEENDPRDRELTKRLYGGDQRYRLAQEIVLGIGGVRMLRALGHKSIIRHHMNEGHAALLALELLREEAFGSSCKLEDSEACMEKIRTDVRTLCVFTTHTPVAAGHDQFPYDMVEEVMGEFVPFDLLKKLAGEDRMNMTLLGLNLSHYVNSVARQHRHISEHLFPGYKFSNITNGVHSVSWTCPEFQELFDEYMPNWRQDSFDLRNAPRIPEEKIWDAHYRAKGRLIDYINKTQGVILDKDVFTIGFARRAASYKRADLIFHDIDRLRMIGKERPIQIIFAGKAHPSDGGGKDMIKKIFWHIGEMKGVVECIYLPDYDIELAKLLIPGVDAWLNTPLRPKEASGTSGMKAAHNAVPQISIQDGWWMEGHLEGITGWEIGPTPTEENESVNDSKEDAEEFYDKLEQVILPMFYDSRKRWIHVMRNSISLNASFFNTHRMVQQYVLHAYLL